MVNEKISQYWATCATGSRQNSSDLKTGRATKKISSQRPNFRPQAGLDHSRARRQVGRNTLGTRGIPGIKIDLGIKGVSKEKEHSQRYGKSVIAKGADL